MFLEGKRGGRGAAGKEARLRQPNLHLVERGWSAARATRKVATGTCIRQAYYPLAMSTSFDGVITSESCSIGRFQRLSKVGPADLSPPLTSGIS